MRNRKPTIILTGGFGNQLFQIAFGMSRFAGKSFNIEGTLGMPRLNLFNELEITEYELPSQIELINSKPSRVKQKLHNLALRIGLHSKTKSENFCFVNKICLQLLGVIMSAFTLTKTSFRVCNDIGYGLLNSSKLTKYELIIGYFQSYRWIDDSVLAQLRAMKYNNKNDILTRYTFEALSAKPIIVHIRLGDYEEENGIGVLPKKYYLDGLAVLTRNYSDSDIWVFSNDLEKAKDYFTSWQGREITFIEDQWKSTTLTFEIMRLGHAYLIANSTFSYWAALLSRNSSAKIIAPEPWFLKAQSPTALIPRNWVKLEL
jgi:hypothetical protein